MKSLTSNTSLDGNIASPLAETTDRFLFKTLNACKSAAGWVANEMATRRAVAELQSLNDHMLKDIGLTRCSIENVVRGKIDDAYGRNRD